MSNYQAKLKSFLDCVHNGIIASCQASEGEPFCEPIFINALAQSCLMGGAKALRLEGSENIEFVAKQSKTFIVGLTKDKINDNEKYSKVYITRTFEDAKKLAESGTDIIALDATLRNRHAENCDLANMINYIHQDLDLPVWADISTYEEAINAQNLGCDIISTTLCGYTLETKDKYSEPAFDLLSKLKNKVDCPIIVEGRIANPNHVSKAFSLGAYSCVVGSAITRPILITKSFVDACPN